MFMIKSITNTTVVDRRPVV